MKKLFFIAVFLVIAQNSFAQNSFFMNHLQKINTNVLKQNVAKFLQDPEVKPFVYATAWSSLLGTTLGSYCLLTEQCSDSPLQVLACTCIGASTIFAINGARIWVENTNESKKQ